MSIQIQHYLVYLIVLAAIFKLFHPLLEISYKKFFSRSQPKLREKDFSCYTDVCSKCSIKE